MKASPSSVEQFFLYNNSFKFESGDEYYTVLGSVASWHIGSETGSGVPDAVKLKAALDNWINVDTENGAKCSYTLYDRIGEVEVFEFYNIREDATQIRLDCYQTSATSNMITLDVINLDDLPRIMLDRGLSSQYTITVEDLTTPDETIPNVYFSLYGTTIYADATHELVIKVTDPFGRTSTTEYHQQAQRTINFLPYGTTVLKNGVLYIGDERGVEFSYLRTVYNVLIYDASTGNLLREIRPKLITNDNVEYEFKPQSGSSTVKMYRIVAIGRASDAILFDQTFAFDTRLPDVEWKNASSELVNVEGQSFVSSVTLDISKSTKQLTFPVMISYTRTLNGHTESRTLKYGTEKITFDHNGVYEVTLRNTVWAKQIFRFEIVNSTDDLVYVYDDGNQIQVSPVDYQYYINGNKIDIRRYIFTTDPEKGTFDDYEKHGLRLEPGRTNYVLAGENDKNYYDSDPENNTIIWRLAVKKVSENATTYLNPIYFATTGVPVGSLNDSNKITLELNGNPKLPTSTSTNYSVPTSTAYNLIYDSYFENLSHQQLTVKLSYRDFWRDEITGACYYFTEGNLILVDCYYNGTLVKTLTNDIDVFTINQSEAGYYEFVVHDLAGNYLYFGDSNDKKSVNYRQNRYLLAVMTKPVVLINNQRPASGMTYIDSVELRLDNYGDDFLNKYYQWLLENDPNITRDTNFFNRYFRVAKIKGTYSGSGAIKDIDITPMAGQTAFHWNQSGEYYLTVTYHIYDPNLIASDGKTAVLTADYHFKIFPSVTNQAFSMSEDPSISVVSVLCDGYEIADPSVYVKDGNYKFDNVNSSCSYVITLKTYNSILHDDVFYEIRFTIQQKTDNVRSHFILSADSGLPTTGPVSVYYNPFRLYLEQGNVTIILYKDFVQQKVISVNSSVLSDSNYASQELFYVTDPGLYRIQVLNASNGQIFSDSWTIEAEQSTFGYIVLAVVLGIVGIGALVFIRMRRKMTTK